MKKQKIMKLIGFIDLHVDGNVEKITDGSILYMTLYLDTIDDVYQLSEQNCQLKFKPKVITSDGGKSITPILITIFKAQR
jgi:hypothetical protein